MEMISLPLFGSLMVVTLILGMGMGYYKTSEYHLTMLDKESMELGSNSKLVDLAYVN